MKDYETVILVITLLNHLGNTAPVSRRYSRRIYRALKLDVVNIVIQHPNLGHIINEMIKVERLKSVGVGVFNHTDGATGVNEQYFGA